MAKGLKKARRQYAVIFDLEFTAWEGSMERRWSGRYEHTEIVQIGAVKLDAERLVPVGEFEILVQPRINPVLSDYLVALTGISNARLKAEAVDFITAYRAFLEFTEGAMLWAFGRDDLIFEANLALYGWKGMEVPPYRNAIPWFREQGIELAGKHACDVAREAGAPFEGRAHDALEDARAVAAGTLHRIALGAPNPFLPEPAP